MGRSLGSAIFLRPVVLQHNCIVGSDQIRSVPQSYPTPSDSMNRSTLGLPVHHQLQEFTQTHVLRVSDAIQPSHLLSSPSPLAPNPSQHQSLFQWVNSTSGGQSSGVSALVSFLPKNTQGWSPLEWTGWISFLYTRSLLFECNKLHWLTVFRWSDIIIILWEKTNKPTNHELVTWTSCQYVKWEIKKITEFCLLKKFCYFFNC